MVQASDHRDDQQEEDNDAPVHPVDEDEDENGGSTDAPELPQEEGEESTEGFGRAEPHVPVRGEHGCGHGQLGNVGLQPGRDRCLP